MEKNQPALLDLITRYKQHLREHGLMDELYKWDLIGKFKGRPDVEATDFGQEVRSVDFKNLPYGVALAVLRHLAKEEPERLRSCIQGLFDENRPLSERIRAYDQATFALYGEIKTDEKKGHHQDERMAGLLLAFHNPDKYPIYKASFYDKFCTLLGVAPKGKGEKYAHYLALLQDFIALYIDSDQELLDLMADLLPPTAYQDPNHLLLAQNILYVMLDQEDAEEDGIQGLDREIIRRFQSIGDEFSIATFFRFLGTLLTQLQLDASNEKLAIAMRKQDKGSISVSLNGRLVLVIYAGKKIGLMIDQANKAEVSAVVTILHTEPFAGAGTSAVFQTISIDDRLATNLPELENIWIEGCREYAPQQEKSQYRIHHNQTLFEIATHSSLLEAYLRAAFGKSNTEIDSTVRKMNTNSPLNQILYGPPGTGKTYNTINQALEILGIPTEGVDRSVLKKAFEEKLQIGQIAFVTFHQSMSYEDFVEGIKPVAPEAKNGSMSYDVLPGIFKNLASKALDNWQLSKSHRNATLPFEQAMQMLQDEVEENPETKFWMQTKGKEYVITHFGTNSLNFKKASGGTRHNLTYANIREMYYGGPTPEKTGLGIYYPGVVKKLLSYNEKGDKKDLSNQNLLPHILIIDEINRGNVSQIFGELITLIEDDKRAGRPEALSVTLPYSKESFTVPPNLYIIGTMNTADRSVEALDTALRRRFEFVEMPPRLDLLDQSLTDATDISPRDILYTINLRIEKLLDRDHQIGHAYFMGLRDLSALKNAFRHKLMPLLQEYFFGDYSKIGLVLGSGFVKIAHPEIKKADDFFADFTKTGYESDLMEKQVWHLVHIGEMSEEDFLSAIQTMKVKSCQL